MAALRGSQQISKFVKRQYILQQRAISKSHAVAGVGWNRDWMPEKKVPNTPEEIAEASKKYNVPPEHYKLPDYPLGDYPDLGVVSQQQRDPNYHWDDYKFRRDWNEFVDIDANINTEGRNDPLYNIQNRYSIGFMTFCLLMATVGFVTFWLWCEKHPYNRNFFDSQRPFNRKELVYQGFDKYILEGNNNRVIHYTFEPAQSSE